MSTYLNDASVCLDEAALGHGESVFSLLLRPPPCRPERFRVGIVGDFRLPTAVFARIVKFPVILSGLSLTSQVIHPDEVRALAADFENTPLPEILRWAWERFGERAAIGTSFQGAGLV